MITQFDQYVESIIEKGSWMPFAYLLIPLLQINYDGKAEGNPYALEWAESNFEFIQWWRKKKRKKFVLRMIRTGSQTKSGARKRKRK